MNKPTLSVIIPTFNEEKNLLKCLVSIKSQNFNYKDIEVIVVDDGSTDHTIEIARKYNTRILYSGFKHIEKSKSIGIKASTGTYLFFMDADITLKDENIFSTAIEILEHDEHITATQCLYWKYDRHHSIVNRYCELYGVNDPFPFYQKKRGIRSYLDNGWIYPKSLVKEMKDYYIVRFTSENLPTLGSQGYMCKSDIIRQYTHWTPYFFHLDITKELVRKGFDTFAMLKLSVEHDYVDSVFQFYKKLYRNLVLFYTYRSYRTYDYNIKSFQFFITLLTMMTIVIPSIDSVKGYMKKPDVAWFLHPFFCFTVPLLYAFVTVKQLIQPYAYKETK